MSLPQNCRRIPLEERMVSAKALAVESPTEPYFAIYDDAFLSILGAEPSVVLAFEEDYEFAHEAGVYIPSQEAVYVTSGKLGDPRSMYIKVNRLSRNYRGIWECGELWTGVVMGNGGVNYKSGVLFCAQGNKDHPGGLVFMDGEPPYATRTLIDGYHGRLFNSVNDVVIHTDGSIWFTDPTYGFDQGFRNPPQLPSQVYRFDPDSGDIRVVADGFGRPNGLCFSPDEQTMYITDTDLFHGDGTVDLTRAATIYAFDVMERNGSTFLANRRVFAMADRGIPDGIKCDTLGNVYSGCADGLNVWTPGGKLIGKVITPGAVVANFCFARKGELILLNEKKVWQVKIDKGTQGALLANMGIAV